jgi:hypothetical protein
MPLTPARKPVPLTPAPDAASGAASALTVKLGKRYQFAKLANFRPVAALLPPRSSHVKMACWAKQGWGGADEFRATIQVRTPLGH